MKYDILTIFPEFFDSPFACGIINKAVEKSIIKINTHDIREFSTDKHNTVDDAPYGGGGGMLMKPEPLGQAIEKVREPGIKSVVILTTPGGEKFSDKHARELATYDQIVIICGRYEGIDDRVREIYVDMEISIGDYVLTGGEYPASVIVDAVSRFIPGVLGNEMSSYNDSFNEGLLEYPQYTRPETFKNIQVPPVLRSGNHKDIDDWRRAQSIKSTYTKRPDLLDEANLNKNNLEQIQELKKSKLCSFNAYIALVHYPVYNNRFKIINTAFTNLDVHDIARAGTTYGIKKFFLVQPNKEQQRLAERVLNHWTEGKGASFNRSRSQALEFVQIIDSIELVVHEIEKKEKQKPVIIVTDARNTDTMTGYNRLRHMIFDKTDGRPFLILFGTGWGLSKEIMDGADYYLKPVYGYTDYNHLSVRSAAAIILDRLFSSTV